MDNRRIMAADSLGGFLYGYKSYSKIRPENNEVIWVHKRYDPQDLRSNAPVQRSKFLCNTAEVDGTVPEHWRRETQPALKTFSRHLEEEKWYSSSPATRCEEWSTLRQILPSKGVPSRTACPRWGTGATKASEFQFRNKKHFPHINSPMTRYVDDMHLTNRLFKLHWDATPATKYLSELWCAWCFSKLNSKLFNSFLIYFVPKVNLSNR